jgi:hypothetical protein
MMFYHVRSSRLDLFYISGVAGYWPADWLYTVYMYVPLNVSLFGMKETSTSRILSERSENVFFRIEKLSQNF